jgi:NAD(P)-dependent dehydrogenase (short-subunit alcohol dehydrogenase family)
VSHIEARPGEKPEGRLAGKVALITGGARGIGAETASTLAQAGAAVMVTDLLESEGKALAARLETAGHRAAFLRHDVTSEAEWQGVVDQTIERFGKLNVLVNNAGIFLGKGLLDTSLEEWQRLCRVNLDGVFLGIKHCVPAMVECGEPCSIINLSSVAGLVGSAGAGAYHATKGGVRLLSKSAALECGRKGLPIRVNSVHPGVIDTDMGEEVYDSVERNDPEAGREAARERIRMLHPIGRTGRAQDIANAIFYLASDESSFVTGSELVVDGGFTAQ